MHAAQTASGGPLARGSRGARVRRWTASKRRQRACGRGCMKGPATEELESGAMHRWKQEGYLCLCARQCWYWRLRYGKLSRPVEGPRTGCLFSGLFWERCSRCRALGGGGQDLLPVHLLPIRALPPQTQSIVLDRADSVTAWETG